MIGPRPGPPPSLVVVGVLAADQALGRRAVERFGPDTDG